MTEQHKEIVLELCNCNMKIHKVAEKLNYHRNTIVYHIGKIKKQTGLNPLIFNDLVKLKDMVNKDKERW